MQKQTNKEYRFIFTVKLADGIAIENVLKDTEYIEIKMDYTAIEVVDSAVFDVNNKKIA